MTEPAKQRRTVPMAFPETDPHVCTPAVRLDVLGRVPLFSMLNATDLDRVSQQCRTQGHAAGDTIYRAGDVAASLYVVATGNLKTTRITVDGSETLLNVLGPGDFVGALPALGQSHYPESASALTPVCMLRIDSDEFTTMMEDLPAVAMAALNAVSGRLAAAHEAVHLLSGASLEQRLAATLLLLAAKAGVPWQGATLIQLPLSNDDLAAMTGVTTESVSRLMSRWNREGLIETGRRWVAISDRNTLEARRTAAE